MWVKKLFFVMAILGCVCFVLSGCNEEQTMLEITTSVESVIVEYAKEYSENPEHSDDEGLFIDISELTGFEWDAMFLYRDGITREQLSELMGINYEGPLDAYEGLIFIKDNRCIYHETLKETKDSNCSISFFIMDYSMYNHSLFRFHK